MDSRDLTRPTERPRHQAATGETTRLDPAHGPQPTVHLTFLDGLRGLAALFVVLHHAVSEVPREHLSRPFLLATEFLFLRGHDAVGVFIVLSGFSLMLPVVRSATGRVRGGTWEYLKRRARRILPAYYAAMAVSLAMIGLIPWLRVPSGMRWDAALPGFDLDSILTHVFLVHNMRVAHAWRIDPPMWSVATEWQIYFLFPLFLALWRRFGISITIVAGFLAGYLVHFGNPLVAGSINPWYAGLFTIGMAVAVGTDPSSRRSERWGDRNVALFAIGIALLTALAPALMIRDALGGAAAAALIAYCVRHAHQAQPGLDRPRIARLLESAPAVRLGAFSYSLYLVHFPLLSLAHAALRHWGVAPDTKLLILLFVAGPATIGPAYLFYRVFERPFLARSGTKVADLAGTGASRAPAAEPNQALSAP